MDNQSDTIGALAAALAKAQGSLNAALKDSKNPHLKNKYADLASIWNAAREPLAANELAVIQTTERDEGGQHLVTTLAHSSGEWIRGQLEIGTMGAMRDDKGNLKGVNYYQALGSSISYMRRYALAAIVGVIQDDDDAHSFSGNNGHRSNPEPQPEIDPRPPLIERIEKAEKSLGEHGNARNNSRKKHLKTKNLHDPSIPLETLQEFFQHVANKFRDKRNAEETAHIRQAAETSEAVQAVIDGIDGEPIAEPQADSVMGRN